MNSPFFLPIKHRRNFKFFLIVYKEEKRVIKASKTFKHHVAAAQDEENRNEIIFFALFLTETLNFFHFLLTSVLLCRVNFIM